MMHSFYKELTMGKLVVEEIATVLLQISGTHLFQRKESECVCACVCVISLEMCVCL